MLRGDIRDRYGNLLVLDVINYDLYNNVRNPDKIPKEKINELAELLGVDVNELTKKLSGKIDTRIFSGVGETQASKIKKLSADFGLFSP
jgi:cell division protein FtsI/penicillin-binding protein 2